MSDLFKDKKRNDTEEHKYSSLALSSSIEQNILLLKNVLSNNSTLKFRNFEAEIGGILKCCIVFLDEMASRQIINENVLKPLMLLNKYAAVNKDNVLKFIINKVLTSNEARESSNMDELLEAVLSGNSLLLVDGVKGAIIISSNGWQSRSVGEPSSEGVVRGPKEGFTESILVNMSLIRRKVKNPELKFEFMNIGTKTKTKISICYIQGLVNEKILDELKKRLDSIKIDGILDSGYIEELIKDNPLSPFKTVGNSERPDTIASKLLEGRIAVLCDGSPFVLTAPFIFLEYFQSSEDYYGSFLYGTLNRLIRIAGFFLTTSLPALYVALITFHQEMIPTPLFISIISAKVISAPIVIVVALTGIGALLLPKMLASLILMRISLLIFASIFGMYGYIFEIILIFIHLTSIESFGIPYMAKINSLNKYELQDCAVRAPWWYMHYYPIFIGDRYKKSK